MPEEFSDAFFRRPPPYPDRVPNWRPVGRYRDAEIVSRGTVAAVRCRIATRFPRLAGRRLAFACDFHTNAGRFARNRAAAVRELLLHWKPDYLLLGGDLVYDVPDLEAFAALLKQLEGLAPVTLAIPGNWERGKPWIPLDFWEKHCRDHGIRFLCNRGYGDGDFFFYGVDDCFCGYPRLPRPAPTAERCNVLLAHRPDTVIGLDVENALAPYRLILCGHTHGGQIRLPWIGSLYASSIYGRYFACGRFRRVGSESEMIVSTGIGNRRFPGRFFCRREIVLIEFQPEAL